MHAPAALIDCGTAIAYQTCAHTQDLANTLLTVEIHALRAVVQADTNLWATTNLDSTEIIPTTVVCAAEHYKGVIFLFGHKTGPNRPICSAHVYITDCSAAHSYTSQLRRKLESAEFGISPEHGPAPHIGAALRRTP